MSVFALTDGATRSPLPPPRRTQARSLDGDEGPNTGGMGAYSPVPGFDADETAELVERIHEPVLAELARRGTPFVGLLYAGLMLTDDGPRVLEFNCRFGDPETQAVLPRLDGDLLGRSRAPRSGDLGGRRAAARRTRRAVTSCSPRPAIRTRRETGAAIDGIDEAEAAGALVFHAGTALRDGELVSAGGRVLGVTGLGATLAEARDARLRGRRAASSFPGAQYRRDIARRRSPCRELRPTRPHRPRRLRVRCPSSTSSSRAAGRRS